MAQPQAAQITCILCNGWYNSESELRDHMQAVHRRSVSAQHTFQNDRIQQDSFKTRLRESKEEWAKLSVQLMNRVRGHFTQEELETIDRFILIACQGSAFEDACR